MRIVDITMSWSCKHSKYQVSFKRHITLQNVSWSCGEGWITTPILQPGNYDKRIDWFYLLRWEAVGCREAISGGLCLRCQFGSFGPELPKLGWSLEHLKSHLKNTDSWALYSNFWQFRISNRRWGAWLQWLSVGLWWWCSFLLPYKPWQSLLSDRGVGFTRII